MHFILRTLNFKSAKIFKDSNKIFFKFERTQILNIPFIYAQILKALNIEALEYAKVQIKFRSIRILYFWSWKSQNIANFQILKHSNLEIFLFRGT